MDFYDEVLDHVGKTLNELSSTIQVNDFEKMGDLVQSLYKHKISKHRFSSLVQELLQVQKDVSYLKTVEASKRRDDILNILQSFLNGDDLNIDYHRAISAEFKSQLKRAQEDLLKLEAFTGLSVDDISYEKSKSLG